MPGLPQVGLPGVVARGLAARPARAALPVVAGHSSLARYGVGMNSTEGRRWLRRG